MKKLIVASAVATMALLGFSVSDSVLTGENEAVANSEYTCGAHRNAKCHWEPRNDNKCYVNTCYGRCGPGCGWSALGSKYTNKCKSHDSCIKTQRCTYGRSQWSSHVNCAGGLPAAVGSWVQSHWNKGFQWSKDSYSGHSKKVKNCCN